MQILVLQGAPLRGEREGQSDDILMSERERRRKEEREEPQEIHMSLKVFMKKRYDEILSFSPSLDAYRDKRIVHIIPTHGNKIA